MRCTVEREAERIPHLGSWSYHFGRIKGWDAGVRSLYLLPVSLPLERIKYALF
ncbi:MAG: hypothetical protein KME31_12320 [Tolypothrix carrinoi HA7290-LM1]|nr:hypothetical protein [Tolypothrix carrinoi HA7290-LM1]